MCWFEIVFILNVVDMSQVILYKNWQIENVQVWDYVKNRMVVIYTELSQYVHLTIE